MSSPDALLASTLILAVRQQWEDMERYPSVLRAQIYALWEKFTDIISGNCSDKVIFTLLSFPTLSFPLQLCIAKSDSAPCQNHTISSEGSGIPDSSKLMKKSRDFHHKEHLCWEKRQVLWKNSLGNRALIFLRNRSLLRTGWQNKYFSLLHKEEKMMGEVS